MSTPVAATNRLLTSEHDAQMARGVLSTLDGPKGYLSVGTTDTQLTALPREIGVLLQQVLQAVALGSTVTVTSIPQELTTSTAAAILRVSRPTLMKMIKEGTIPAHKVGSHTRLKSSDVLAARKSRRDRERTAFEALLELEGDEIS